MMKFNNVKNIVIVLLSCLITLSASASTDLNKHLSLKNPKLFSENVVTGGQPSMDDLTMLAQKGFKKIINLRPVDEFSGFDEKATVNTLKMKYINIPVGSGQEINLSNLALFTKALGSNDHKKTLVHCASGNRVGAFFALDAYFNHKKSLEDAIDIGKKAGLTRLEKRVRALIEQEK